MLALFCLGGDMEYIAARPFEIMIMSFGVYLLCYLAWVLNDRKFGLAELMGFCCFVLFFVTPFIWAFSRLKGE